MSSCPDLDKAGLELYLPALTGGLQPVPAVPLMLQPEQRQSPPQLGRVRVLGQTEPGQNTPPLRDHSFSSRRSSCLYLSLYGLRKSARARKESIRDGLIA